MSKIIAIFFVCLSVQCEEIIISEIFGNSVGKGRDQGKEWIEIANLSNDKILVKSFALEIYIGKDQNLFFTKNIFLSEPILFFDYILIAQEFDLGLKFCFKEDIPIILMPEFSIKNDSDQKICVAINAHRSCVTIPKKAKMLDGVSLFRELNDMNDQPLWRNEPCFLSDNVFASPGMPSRFCSHEENSIKPFQRCEEKSQAVFNVSVDRVIGLPKPAPKISLKGVKISYDKKKELMFSLADENKEEIWLMSLCAAPKESNKICHLLSLPQNISRKAVLTSSLNSWHKNMGDILFLNVSHITQKSVQLSLNIKEFNEPFMSDVLWQPQFSLDTKEENLTIRLMLRSEELPINISLLTDNGEIVGQWSFLASGEKIVNFFIDKNNILLFLKFAGSRGVITVPLAKVTNIANPNAVRQ